MWGLDHLNIFPLMTAVLLSLTVFLEQMALWVALQAWILSLYSYATTLALI